MQALAFDLGGTHLRGAIVDLTTTRHLMSLRMQNGDYVSGKSGIWERVLTEMVRYAREQVAELDPADPIVVSFPGPVAGGRHILHAPTLCGIDTDFIDLAGFLEAETGRRTYLLNDVSAAAWCLSAFADVDHFLVVTVSSGIGSKTFDRRHGRSVLDQCAYAGEIGHYVVDDDPDALLCDCGGRGHLGAIASGRGIERTARLRAHRSAAGFAGSYIHTHLNGCPETLTNEHHLVPAALIGDPWALAVIRDCTRPLARTLLCSTLTVGLERVYIIGGFAEALGEVYLNLLRELVMELSDYHLLQSRIKFLIAPGYSVAEPCLVGCGVFLNHLSSTAGTS
ncbi:MAG: ROK family protein [Janthinobacterium lividum]